MRYLVRLRDRFQAHHPQFLQMVVVITPFAVLSIAAVGMLMYSFTRPLRVGPPYSYTQAAYQPVRAQVCPGDILAYHYAVMVQRGPARVTVSQTWYDRDTNHAALIVPSTANTTLIVLAEDVGLHADTGRVTVPQLPAGHYELREAAGESTSTVAVTSVPFEVMASCK